MHPRSKHWHQLDFIICKQRDIHDFHITRAMGRLLSSRYLPRSSVYWQIIGLLRWPTSITVKVWGQYCAIEKTRSTLIFYWLVKMWASSLAFSWTKIGFGKRGKKKCEPAANVCEHHGKTLSPPRQNFENATANVCAHHGESEKGNGIVSVPIFRQIHKMS